MDTSNGLHKHLRNTPDRRFFQIGRDAAGNWVASEQNGRSRGLFRGRDEAVRFALSQNGNRRNNVLIVEGPLGLALSFL